MTKKKKQAKFPTSFWKEEISNIVPHSLRDVTVSGERVRQQRTKRKGREAIKGVTNFAFRFCKALKCGHFAFCILICYRAKTKNLWKFGCDSLCMSIVQGLVLEIAK